MPETELCVYCDGDRAADYFTEPDARYNPCCAECHARLFVVCDHCDQEREIGEMVEVCVARQTHESPAEYEDVCRDCAERHWDDIDE